MQATSRMLQAAALWSPLLQPFYLVYVSPLSESFCGLITPWKECFADDIKDAASSSPLVTSPAAFLAPVLMQMQSGLAAKLTGIAEELQALQWVIASLSADRTLITAVSPSPLRCTSATVLLLFPI